MFFIVTLLILYGFMESQSEVLKVVGPDGTLDAVAGEDLVLPCSLKPNISAMSMTVEWVKLDVKDSLVHFYNNHEDKNEEQAQSYRGRTSLFKEELQKGNASLKLSALRVSDEGEYRCRIVDKSWNGSVIVRIFVEGMGSHPVITTESFDKSGGINLVCESRGWNPKPEVLWLDREGVTLPAEDTEIHREAEGFSVKRRITVYDYSDSNRFYCRFQQTHHMMEAEVIINSQVFDTWKFVIGMSVPACLTAVGLIVTTAMFYKKVMLKHSEDLEWQMMEKFVEPQRKRIKQVLEQMKKHAEEVTLDPDTAHTKLILSADGKKVKHGDERQNLPETPQRFKFNKCVLGKQSLSSGRFYYEVQVSGITKWKLGVVRENIDRIEFTFSPQAGVWTVGMKYDNENKYYAYAGPDVPLTLREKVEKVGLFVDYEAGLVSFYDVKSSSHIYSFIAQSFTEKLYPFFCTDNDKNSEALIITDVLNTK